MEGRSDEADALLAKYADDTDVLRSLVLRALDAGNHKRAVAQARALADQTARPQDRLLLARALDAAGDGNELGTLLRSLSEDSTQPDSIRAEAFALQVMRVPRTNFAALNEISERWAAAVPTDEEAVWQRVYALANLARHMQAHQLILDHDLQPQTPERAFLVGAIATRVMGPLDAAERVAELSDRFDRQDEHLEALFLMTALTTSEQADKALLDRIGESLGAFHERFPDSTILRKIEFDEDNPQAALDRMREIAGEDDREHTQQIASDIETGDGPVSLLAQVVGKTVGEILMLLPLLPVAYGHEPLTAAELQSAQAALGAPAVWDTTAATTLGLLDEKIGHAALALFQGSVITQSSLEQCDHAVARLSDHDEVRTLDFVDDGVQQFITGAEDLDRQRSGLRAAVALAVKLTAVANTDPDRTDALDEVIHDDPRHAAWNTWPATISIARRRGIAIYSDDRYVRMIARRDGLQAFGTDTVIEALRDAGRITDTDARDARLTLLRHGAVGLRP